MKNGNLTASDSSTTASFLKQSAVAGGRCRAGGGGGCHDCLTWLRCAERIVGITQLFRFLRGQNCNKIIALTFFEPMHS
eukprot:scaffold223786_cov37-Prasinocladus_malaysianus.AAC.1